MSFTLRETDVSTKEGTARLSYFVCEPLERAGFQNAFSTRMGGVSDMPAGALHLGSTDETPERRAENRRRFVAAVSRAPRSFITVKQTHSDKYLVVNAPFAVEPEADALLTDNPNLLIAVKTADCVPILIGDPKSGAMAAVHAGWRGTLERIVEKAMAGLKEKFNIWPRDCVAAIGPAACGRCYEVGAEVADLVTAKFGPVPALDRSKDKYRLDVSALNALQLRSAGLSANNIHFAERCTMHENALFFSHRAESGAAGNRVGRLAAAIGRHA